MYRVGVDLGGTNITVGIIDENLTIIGRSKLKTNLPRHFDEVFSDIIRAIYFAIEDADISIIDISSIGVGVPGAVDSQSGVIDFSSNLKIYNMSIKSELEKTFNKPVFITNDANCAALAEKKVGAGRNAKNLIAITLGTGIGGGVIINDKLITGVNGATGEIGHMVIDFDGIECGCGRKGCWEKYASATALARQTKEALAKDLYKKSIIWEMIENDLSKIGARTAFEAMKNGDKIGKQIVDGYIKYLACGITNLINIFQPDVLCIGGGMSNEGDTLLIPVIRIVEKERYSLYSSKQTKICIAELKNDAGIIGAALLNEI